MYSSASRGEIENPRGEATVFGIDEWRRRPELTFPLRHGVK
jgi:hypothetical protein